MRKGKLELDWVDKGDIILTKFSEDGKTYPASYFQGQVSDEELMPRELELIESVGDPKSENMLIRGENLISLRSLEKEFAGNIKLIYIDPPFNTGQDFEDYEDGLEHSIWLSMMENRLRLAKKFLSPAGLIFVHIDYNEIANLKLLMDEVFTRDNYITLISWQRAPERTVLGQGQTELITLTEYLLVYSRNKDKGKLNRINKRVKATKNVMEQYRIYVEKGEKHLVKKWEENGTPIKIWEYDDYNLIPLSNKTSKSEYIKKFAHLHESVGIHKEHSFMQRILKLLKTKKLYCVEYTPTKGKSAGVETSEIFFNGRKLLPAKNYAEIGDDGEIYRTTDMNNFWTSEEIGVTGISSEGDVELKRGKKPETLMKRIIDLATKENDIVLDFFAGSGTTGAVAHKMGRKWIMVEIRKDMIREKALKRMKNVVHGDTTGISKEVGWKGGGGFKFYKLGEPLIIKHKDYPSIKIINPKYYNTALIKVICNLEGFRFRKDDKLLHGVNKLGNKYAHITEQYVSQSYVDLLKSKLVDNEEMIVYCFNYDERITLPSNMIIKKLPVDLGKPYQLRLKL